MPSWKGKGANICDECTTLKQDLMSEEIFGCLNPGYSVEYYNASKKAAMQNASHTMVSWFYPLPALAVNRLLMILNPSLRVEIFSLERSQIVSAMITM